MSARTDEILSLLLSLPPDERSLVLADRSEDDESLLGRIRHLLGVADRHGDAFELLPPKTPRQIGRFPVLRQLGRGGMGEVYLSRDPDLGRPVAIKVLRSDLSVANDANRTTLATEGRLLATVSHPNLATVYSFETDGDLAFLTMEMVEGETLASRFAEGLDYRSCLLVMRQVALALEAIHRVGIVHCDLSPRNVCLRADGVAKVLDFGLSRLVATSPRPEFGTVPVGVMGTPGYMSPEQILGVEPDLRSDLFAFGCLLYEGLTGRPAFRSDSLADCLTRTLTEQPPLTEGLLPEAILTLLRTCLEKTPGDRNLSAGEIADRIGVLLDGTPGVRSRPQSTPRARLPVQLTAFVGREAELELVRSLVHRHRLVTVRGLAGVGKTRLAVEAGRCLSDSFRVLFLELRGLRTWEDTDSELFRLLGMLRPPLPDALPQLSEALERSPTLILFDSCEEMFAQLLGPVTELLERVTSLHILTTSRRPLGLVGEAVVPLGPLSLAQKSQRSEAARLFLDRAHLARPDLNEADLSLNLVDDICQFLDGVPLAIELAAARIRTLPLSVVAKRTRELGHFGEKGPVANPGPLQHPLFVAIDHSHDILTPEERTVFRRVSIFRGSFTLEAAEAVSSLGLHDRASALGALESLLDHSLLEVQVQETAGTVAYRLLEVVRDYAALKCDEAGETPDAWTRFGRYSLELASPNLEEPDRYDSGLDVLRGTIDAFLCRRDGDFVTSQLLLANRLVRYWHLRGRSRHAAAVLAELTAQIHPSVSPGTQELWIKSMITLSASLIRTFDYEGTVRTCSSALELLDGAPSLDRALEGARARCLSNLATAYTRIDRLDLAFATFRSALSLMEEGRDDGDLGRTWNNLALLHLSLSEPEEALIATENAIRHRRLAGDSAGEAVTCHNRALVLCYLGRAFEAETTIARTLEIRGDGNPSPEQARSLATMAMILVATGSRDPYPYLLQAHDLCSRLEDLPAAAATLKGAGCWLHSVGRHAEALLALTVQANLESSGRIPGTPAGSLEANHRDQLLEQVASELLPEEVAEAHRLAMTITDPYDWMGATLARRHESPSDPSHANRLPGQRGVL